MVQLAGSLDLFALGLARFQTYPGSKRLLLVVLFEGLKKKSKLSCKHSDFKTSTQNSA